MKKSCSIFFYEGYVGVAPTIINLSKIIEKFGYSVTIYSTQNEYPSPGKIGTDVKVIDFRKEFTLIELLKESKSKILAKFKGLVPVAKAGIFSFQSVIDFFLNQPKNSQENINIGVDIYGSVAALIKAYIFQEKFLFLSLELGEKPDSFRGFATILKYLTNSAYQKAAAVIVQDEERFESLCDNYQYRHPKVFYLPNSPLGIDEQSPPIDPTNYFREKFNLSEERFPYIALQAGMINGTVHAQTLAKTFLSIDNGCALVLHERQARSEKDAYIESLRQINSQNLFLSLEPLPYDQIDRIYTSSTIGLVFYNPPESARDDFLKIAKASGKLPQYLKHGKPILVSNLPSLKQLVEQYQCGLVIKDPSDSDEMNSALGQILGNYDTYSSNAKACFDAEFDFGKKMEPILSFIENLTKN